MIFTLLLILSIHSVTGQFASAARRFGRPRDPGVKRRVVRITVATANLGRGVAVGVFVANLRRLLAKVLRELGGFIGLQEMDEADVPDEHRILRDMAPDGTTFAGWETRCPILVPPDWRIVHGTETVTPASKGVPKLSPGRVVVDAVVEPRRRVYELLWHFVRDVLTQADSSHRGGLLALLNWHSPRNVDQLANERQQVLDVVARRIRALHKLGWDVIATCDANDLALLQHLDVGLRIQVLARHGLDYVLLIACPGNHVAVEQLNAGSVDLDIDGHNAHWTTSRLTITRPRNRPRTPSQEDAA